MNYRHAFHAGNHADVIKHAVLMVALARLTAKPAPLALLDTHAGRGLYDLTGEAAQRSPEWRQGVGRLAGWGDAPESLRPYLDRAFARPNQYPGSGALALSALRAGDRYIGCELNPEEASALKARFAADTRAELHFRCGYEALAALLPFPERRGLVLVDPPYEREDEFDRAVQGLKTALRRFRQGVYLWWRPLKQGQTVDRADAELLGAEGPEWLRIDAGVAAPRPDGPLVAASLLMLNPPYPAAAILAEAGPALIRRLSDDPGAFFILKGPAAPPTSLGSLASQDKSAHTSA